MGSNFTGRQNTKRRSIFLNRNFNILFSARLVSDLCEVINIFAIVWYILKKTGSPMQVGILLAVSIIPAALTGPFAGILVDRFDRKKLLVLMDAMRGITILIMGVLFFFGLLHIWLLYIGCAVTCILGGVFFAASMSVIPNIVEEEQLNQANSIYVVVVNIAQLFGALCGGFLFSLIGIFATFILNSISYFISAAMLMFINYKKKHTIGTIRAEGDKDCIINNIISKLKGGYLYLRDNDALFSIFIYLNLVKFLIYPISGVYIPYIFNKLLNTEPAQLSFAQAAFGIGVIVGAVLSPIVSKKLKIYKQVIYSWYFLCFILCGLIIPIIPVIMNSFTSIQSITIYIVSVILGGAFYIMGEIPFNVVFQREVADEYRGRVTAFSNAFSRGAMALGYLIGGIVSNYMPMYLLLLLISVMLLLITLKMSKSNDIKIL